MIKKILLPLLFLFISSSVLESKNSEIIRIGDKNARIVIKVFSSLTCPHCASFHNTIFNNLKKDYIDKGLVKFEHHPFPLDLAALNAEIILRCHIQNAQKFKLLSKIYEKQKLWAVGSDINKINDSIKEIGLSMSLRNEEMDTCLNDDKAQDEILNQRIEAQKIYKIEATPTIFINEKKYSGEVNYNNFKKALEKYL